ncbi:serine/threonine protein kinase [Niallia circulans]|uniref:serine/threonine protein kinase n=1 Tax=Niallia circulans TaxID=1397 RepID=UPI0026EAD53F|nr:protein kinase [Niallia circulans]
MKWSYLTRWIFDRPHKKGTTLYTYEVEKCLGLGAYGIIYLCKDRMGKKYVVKQLRPSKGKKQRERMRFKDEGELLRKIDCHAIPSLLDVFTIEKHPYYVMEYINGENIEDLLFFQKQKFTEFESLRMMKQLLSIINYLHDHHIYHTDIRPPNVILKQKKVYLIDFGLAKRVDIDNLKEVSNSRQDDYYDFGQMLLFLLYSNFKGKKGKKHTWLEELTLHPATVQLLKRLLGISIHYSSGVEIEKDLDNALAILKEAN